MEIDFTFQYMYDICLRILEGLSRFAGNAFKWMFTAKDFNFSILDIIGIETLSITPFELLIDTFFVVAVVRIVLNFNG